MQRCCRLARTPRKSSTTSPAGRITETFSELAAPPTHTPRKLINSSSHFAQGCHPLPCISGLTLTVTLPLPSPCSPGKFSRTPARSLLPASQCAPRLRLGPPWRTAAAARWSAPATQIRRLASHSASPCPLLRCWGLLCSLWPPRMKPWPHGQEAGSAAAASAHVGKHLPTAATIVCSLVLQPVAQ